MIRLICRKVVLETLFCIGFKSAKMLFMGFLGEFWSWSTKLYYKKPYPLTSFLAKVLTDNPVLVQYSGWDCGLDVDVWWRWPGGYLGQTIWKIKITLEPE